MFTKAIYQKLVTALIFVGVIAANAAANGIPLNGYTTGELSDRYVNLFTPAGFTFSIWGAIYLGLLGVVLIALFAKSPAVLKPEFTQLWVVNGLANIAWIFAWHYLKIASSMVIMLIILLSLVWITDLLQRIEKRDGLTRFSSAVFGLYFGWITVATIANATALLVAFDFDGWSLSEAEWTVVMICAAALISGGVFIFKKSIWYLLPILWAFYGIHAKHGATWGFRNAYPEILSTLQWAFGALLFLVLLQQLLARKKRS